MRGIAAVLIVAAVTLPAQARGPRLSAADADCPDKVATSAKAVAPTRASSPVRDTQRTKPTVHGDVADPARLHSPRWHSFLPGMIR